MKAIFFGDEIEQYFLGHQFSKVFKEKIYEPYLSGKKDLTIVDIGSCIGVTALYFSQFAKRMVCVEPSKEHLEFLTKMVEFNELKDVSLINKAIYIKPGSYPLFHPNYGNKTMFTLFANIGAESSEPVEAITIEDLFIQEKLDHVDFLKMDIEGTEDEVLAHTSFRNVADKIDTIVVEGHVWNARHENQLPEALKNAGFKVSKIQTEANLYVGTKL